MPADAAAGLAGHLGRLEELRLAVINEAQPAIGRIYWFGSWWTLLTFNISKAKQELETARAGLRRGLVGGHDQGWMDQAGDSFDTRWKLADVSLAPWSDSGKRPPSPSGLQNQVNTTRQLIEQAIEAIKAQMAAVAGGHVFNPKATQEAVTAAYAEYEALDKRIGQIAAEIGTLPPQTPWNGPMASTGQAPAGVPGQAPEVAPAGPFGPGGPSGPSQAAADPSVTGPAATDPAATPPGGGPTGGGPTGGGPTGGAPTGGPAGAPGQMPSQAGGPGLAGTTPTLTPPATGLPTVPNLPPTTPPQVPYSSTPAGIPYLPATVAPPATQTRSPGAGLGKPVIGGGGGGKVGSLGLGKYDFGGVLDSTTGRTGNDTTNAPAQAARQMNRGALPTIPPAPTPPSAMTPATGSSPAGGSPMPPPMMPPMLGGAGEGKPKPGTAAPVVQGKGGPQNRMPGVPPKLRGRSGKTDSAHGFGVPAVARRPKAVEAEKLDTVQLLDEELWAVEQPAGPGAPTVNRTKLRGH